ncbi:MAG: pyridoxamine 5'-phosphate oxidase family protein [Mycetocola sp.]
MTENPYLQTSTQPAAAGQTHILDETECWRLLAENSVARLAVSDDLGPNIFPLNYLVKSQVLFFRSAPGSKIVSLTQQPRVAVEIDGTDGGKRFSVVVRGDVRRLNDDAHIHESTVDTLPTMTGSDKWNYFAITPRQVTGIRFRTSR